MEQQSTSRRSVALAAAAVVIAFAAFAAAFYLFDGSSVVTSLLAGDMPFLTKSPSSVDSSAAPAPTSLRLPAGMPEDFALRLWQEQVDSQGAISKLVSGDVSSLSVDAVDKQKDLAKLRVTVAFKDGTSAPGILAMRRFSDVWYVAYATGMRDERTSGDADVVGSGGDVPPTSALPRVSDVDIALLNTILDQNAKSKASTQEYVDGVVKQVNLEEAQRGPGTATIKISMNETHEEGYGQIVAIRKELNGREVWFLARFTKTQAPAGS